MKSATYSKALSVISLAVVALASLPAAASPYTSMVVFGDSLSDSGNNSVVLGNNGGPVTGNTYVPSSGPYATGVYSNGPVWASDVASILGLTLAPSQLKGTNFAYGGATTGTPGQGPGGFPFSLVTQANQYLAATGNVASPTSLYVIEGGGNNVRAALAAIAGGAPIGPTILTTAAAYPANVGSIVDALQAAGAQHIVVWDTPNVGAAPATLANGIGAVALATGLAASMNAALAAKLFGEAGVSIFDIFGLGTSIALNPGAFGFTNATDACGATAIGTDCSNYVYWDGIHPTAAAHMTIAEAFLTIAAPVPEPSTWAMMILGFAGIGFIAFRRRNQNIAPRAA